MLAILFAMFKKYLNTEKIKFLKKQYAHLGVEKKNIIHIGS